MSMARELVRGLLDAIAIGARDGIRAGAEAWAGTLSDRGLWSRKEGMRGVKKGGEECDERGKEGQ
jgi:hypothetical protein